MKIASVRALKEEAAEEVRASAGDGAEARAFYASTGRPMPSGVALGVGKRPDGEHVLVVRSADPVAAAAYADRARGEADVRIVTVTKRPTPAYLQARQRPLEPGLQIQMKDKGFVGTLGCIARDAATGLLGVVTNSHVAADEGRAQPGHVIGQPFGEAAIGTLTRFVPFSQTAPNLVDAAFVTLDPAVQALLSFTVGVALKGVTALLPSDLGRTVYKVGRTTGARQGKITAVEVDGLPVAYDSGVLRFNDQIEVSGGPTTTFSQAGDSGSMIVTDDDYALGLLFAGGVDSTGEDFTYANPLAVALAALGVEMA